MQPAQTITACLPFHRNNESIRGAVVVQPRTLTSAEAFANASRLATFATSTFRLDADGVVKELRAWRDKYRIDLGDSALAVIAAHTTPLSAQEPVA